MSLAFALVTFLQLLTHPSGHRVDHLTEQGCEVEELASVFWVDRFDVVRPLVADGSNDVSPVAHLLSEDSLFAKGFDSHVQRALGAWILVMAHRLQDSSATVQERTRCFSNVSNLAKPEIMNVLWQCSRHMRNGGWEAVLNFGDEAEVDAPIVGLALPVFGRTSSQPNAVVARPDDELLFPLKKLHQVAIDALSVDREANVGRRETLSTNGEGRELVWRVFPQDRFSPLEHAAERLGHPLTLACDTDEIECSHYSTRGASESWEGVVVGHV